MLRDFTLDLEDVGQLPVVSLGPQVLVGFRVDELSHDPHAVAGTANAALENGRHLEFVSYLAQAVGRILVSHYGSA